MTRSTDHRETSPGVAEERHDAIRVHDRTFVPFLSSEEILQGVDRVAEAIRARHSETNPLCICVLKGAVFFYTDLLRRLDFPLEADFVRVSSYGSGMRSGGTLTFTAEPGTEVAGRNVIVVEDIVDTGRTIAELRRYLSVRGATTVEVASLLYKPEADEIGSPPEFTAFEIPNRFVVGYGLDYAEEGRNLPGLFVLAPSEHAGNDAK